MAAAPTAARYDAAAPWMRGLEAMREERDVPQIERIEGRLPAALRGTLFRIGPGQNDVAGHHYHHWFDGDGMVCAFRFDGQHVGFQNRYVRTRTFERERAAGRMLAPNFGTPLPGGLLANRMRPPKNPANTNAMVIDDRLLALWEGGRPYALDPETLETLGEWDFHGTLRRGSFFSAHPHRCPTTGTWINVGSVMGPRPQLQIWSVGADGRCRAVRRVPLSKAFMVHDYGLTPKHVVVVGAPFWLEPRRLPGFLLGRRSLLDCFAWQPDQATTVIVAEREGHAPPRIYELPAGMVFHVANAFEDSDDTVVDVAWYGDDGALRIVVDAFHGRPPQQEPGTLQRLRIPRHGRPTLAPLCDEGLDFPRIDDRRSTLAYETAYALEFRRGELASSRILKVDTAHGGATAHDFGTGCIAGEPVFVPRPDATATDDGWVLSLVYDSRDHHSFLGIVDTDRFGAEDVRLHLDFHTPIGFHGSFHPAA